MNNFVSVIVPVYNGKATLSLCLGSLMNQTCADYEVIVVDNASTDESKKIINSFAEKSKKFQYIFEARRSRGHARNAGIKNSQGKILLFTDQDCIAPKDWITNLSESIIEGERAAMGLAKDLVKNYWTNNIQKFDDSFLDRLDKDGYIGHVDTKNFAITGELMKSLMFDGKLGNMEDFEFYLRLKKKKVPIRFLSEVVVGHHHNSSFIKVIESNFSRGYWVAKIYKKHHQSIEKKELMFATISVINFIYAPLWYVIQLAKTPRYFPYIISSDLAWRAGIIWAQVK